ncbi:MAG: ABC transporter permease subunit [Alphaproteobacteria bacterium]|nr:ABC transporter permease subunit [Alphaproteobacteria bacterium]
MSAVRRFLPALLAGLGVLALWAAVAAPLSPVLLPSPLEVAQAAVAHRERLLQATLHTGLASVAGLLVAVVLALLGAVAFHLSRALELALYPYALVVQTLPVVAVAPLLVVWLGYGTPVAVAAAAIVAFFPVLTSTHLGLRAADAGQVELLRLYGATRWQELARLRLPAALPFVFGGLRAAGGLSVIGAVVGEFVGSNGVPPSLGYLVVHASRSAETPLSFAAIGCSAMLALLLFSLTRLLERRFVDRWHGAPASS